MQYLHFLYLMHNIKATAVTATQLPMVRFQPSFSTITPIVKVEIAVPRYAIEFSNPDTVATLPTDSNRRANIFTNNVFTAIIDAVMTANRMTVSTMELPFTKQIPMRDIFAIPKKTTDAITSLSPHFLKT